MAGCGLPAHGGTPEKIAAIIVQQFPRKREKHRGGFIGLLLLMPIRAVDEFLIHLEGERRSASLGAAFQLLTTSAATAPSRLP